MRRLMSSPRFVILLLLLRSYSALDVVTPGMHNALIGSTTLVPCSFTVGSPPVDPRFLAILWQYGEKEVIRYDNKEKYGTPRMSIDEEKARWGDASLIIQNVTIGDQGTYKCLVIYSPNKGAKEIQVNVQAAPEVTLVKKSLSKNGKNRLHCLIRNFYPKDIAVTWLRNGQTLNGSELGPFEMDGDGTYIVNSSLTISPKQSQDHPIIACQVDHVSLPDPIQDAFTVQYGAEPKIAFFSSHDGDKEIFVCEVKEFYPEAVEMNWLIDGKRTDPPRRNADGTFNKWNHFWISGKQKRPNNISCVVEHETLDSPLMKSLTVKDKKDSQTPALIAAILLLSVLLTVGILAALWIYKKKYFQRFQVSPIHIPAGWSSNTDKVTMYCTASNCPATIQVTWTVIENDGKKVNIAEHQKQSNAELGTLICNYEVGTHQSEMDGLYSAITSLTFTPTILKHRNMKVICSFFSSGKSQKKVKEWSLTISKPCLSPPLKMSLIDIGDVACSVTLEKFYPKNIRIKWSSGVGNYQELGATREEFIDNTDYTFKCESECQVPGHLFQDPGFRVRVVWEHQSLNQPEIQEVTATDLPWRPLMGDITMPLLVHSRVAKLECVISGYFPNSLEVKWLRREAGNLELYDVPSSDKYKIPLMDIKQECDKTYTCTTSLIVSMSAKTDQGVQFICRVRHPSLKNYLEKGTGELTVKGEPVIRRILQFGLFIILEADSFYTPDLAVSWEQSDKQGGQYKSYEEKRIRSSRRENSDSSYSFTSICEAMTLTGLVNPMDKYIKATITHEALESAKPIFFLRSKGYFYILSESGKTMLNQADHDILESYNSKYRLKVSTTKNSEES